MPLKAIRELVRHGRYAEAQYELSRREIKRLPRKARLEAASLAREADAPERVIELLYPIIRPSQRGKQVAATFEEKGEYAKALLNLGLLGEAKALLKGLSPGSHPRAADAFALTFFREDDFETAYQITTEALASTSPMRNSDRIELMLDRGLSLLHSKEDRYGKEADFGDVRTLLGEFQRESETGSFDALKRLALIGVAISHLYERNWVGCERGLKEAAELFRKTETVLRSPVLALWQCLAELGRAVDRGETVGPYRKRLVALREAFIAAGKSSFARSCDYNEALLLGDHRLLKRMYFSAPQHAVRRRIEKDLARSGDSVPEVGLRDVLEGQRPAAVPLDLWDPKTARAIGLKPDQVPHRILTALAADDYSRPNLIHLFGLAFPDEYYRPNSSPAKIATGLARLRQALKSQRAPLSVAQKGGLYFIETSVPVALAFRRAPKQATIHDQVGATFGQRRFSPAEFRSALGISASTAKARLKRACEEGWMLRFNHGRATRYRLR